MTLPPKQQAAIQALRSGPTTAVECARELDTARKAAEYALKALCARGLAMREETRIANNRIEYLYTLTNDGREWLHGSKPVAGVQSNPFLWRTFVQPFMEVRA